MPSTRSSARLSQGQSSPATENTAASNGKRKAESSPASAKAKKGRKGAEKEQKTIEETLGGDDSTADQPKDIEMKEAGSAGEGENAQPDKQEEARTEKNGEAEGAEEKGEVTFKRGPSCWFWLDTEAYPTREDADKAAKEKQQSEGGESKTITAGDSFKGKNKEGESMDDPEKALKDSRGGPGLNTLDAGKEPENRDIPHDDVHVHESTKPADKEDTTKPSGESENKDSNGGAVDESKERADAMPSNILEKGIIYFFTRGRVGIDDPDNVQDLQRSYFVLRPLPRGAKLTDGAIDEGNNNRLFALPKKVWPKSSADKFMVFVEKAKTTMADLKENFFAGNTYETQTVGTRTTPPVTPIGEGVYAITVTEGRSETHLAYMLTIPREPGEMQEDVGLRSKGSFVISLKNPTVKGPAYASLPEKPDFPEEFIKEFNNRGWMPAHPKHLDYAHTQLLLIGESLEDSHALDATAKDEKSESKETPMEEMEKLEHEDEIRVEGLKGDDTVFEDLGLSHKEYPSVPTTW